jgi:hypothetical protein
MHRAARLGHRGRRCAELLAAVLLAAAAAPTAAQQQVRGTVVDQGTGRPLPGVAVEVVESGRTVATDSVGRFAVHLPDTAQVLSLTFSTLGYASLTRSYLLPLDRSLAVGLTSTAVEIEGIEVRARRPLLERMDGRLSALGRFATRTASQGELRAFAHQEADLYDFLPEMNVAVGVTGCLECMMMNGGFRARFFLDDFEIPMDEFRSLAVEQICRVEVVRKTPRPGRNSTLIDATGGVHAYTCDYMMAVARGEETLTPFLWPWDSPMDPGG